MEGEIILDKVRFSQVKLNVDMLFRPRTLGLRYHMPLRVKSLADTVRNADNRLQGGMTRTTRGPERRKSGQEAW
jgi:hypothetical protein